MRLLPFVIACVAVVIPVQAIAKPKPKIAIAPLDGDVGNKVGLAVVDALDGKDFVVISPKDTKRELTKLGAADELGAKDVRKLTTKLGAIAVIDGKVSKTGKKHSLHLEVHRRGKPDAGFTIEFKLTATDGFRRGVHDEVMKKLDGATEDTDEEPEKPVARAEPRDDDPPKRKPIADDDPPKRKPVADDDPPKRKKIADDDPPKRKKIADATGDDGEPAVRKRKHTLGEDQPVSQMLARVGAGGSVGQRRLSYNLRPGFTQIPPPVVTTAGGGRVDGEIYPFALANAASGGAGFGFAASYDKTFGLSIKVPNTTTSAPIDQSRYSVGARYRFTVGETSAVALGLDYYGRSYIADRSGLMANVLDTPDFKYSAVAPGISARTPVAPTVTLFGGLDGLLMLDAGPVVKATSYGSGTVYGVEAAAGIDVALTQQIGLRLAAEYSQINLSFSNKGTQDNNRDNDPTTQDVMGAVDRSIGVSATLGLTY
ncbi:MAG TPA: hypothetical protein VH165_07815 [Kofleriaceae bacterium]|nr:hypothetical protein [Kofleriaceae bacterium]